MLSEDFFKRFFWCGYFYPINIFLIVKTNDFRGGLRDVSAQTATLVGLCSIEKHCKLWACNFMSDQFSNLSIVAVILFLKKLRPSVFCFGRCDGSMVLLGNRCGKKGSSGTGPKKIYSGHKAHILKKHMKRQISANSPWKKQKKSCMTQHESVHAWIFNEHTHHLYCLFYSCRHAITSRADLAQLGERKTEDLDVAGSIPAIRSAGVVCAIALSVTYHTFNRD